MIREINLLIQFLKIGFHSQSRTDKTEKAFREFSQKCISIFCFQFALQLQAKDMQNRNKANPQQ